MKVLVLIALAGCYDYSHMARRNAPGTVDLSKPLDHENGDPARFERAGDPGGNLVAVIPTPYMLWGHGRLDASSSSVETGLHIRIERAVNEESSGWIDRNAWALTAGFAIAQGGDGRRDDVPGAFSLEINRRQFLDEIPADLGAGPAIYLSDREVGVQVSLRIAAIFALQTRFLPRSGTEIMAGFEVPIPLLFGWSR
jgi:hypothetical protein